MLGFRNLRARVWPWLVVFGALLLIAVARAPAQGENGAATIVNLQARLSNLDPQVTYLKDRSAILEVSKQYTRGADRHDKELVRAAFWPEATVSYGRPMPRDEYVEWEERRLRSYAAHQHHVTGQSVEFDGDTAHVESYVIYFLVPRDRSHDAVGRATPGRALTSEKTLLGSGRYIERWERRDGEWKILVREYVEDLALKGDTVDLCESGCMSRWDRDDLSYDRPLRHLTQEERRARAAANRPPRTPVGAGGGQ